MAYHDACDFYEGVVEYRHIRARNHYHAQTIYVDNVPAWDCIRCGEQYFDAPLYKWLEAITKHSEQIRETVCFPLAQYNMALDEFAQAD